MIQTTTISPFSTKKKYQLKWGKQSQKSIPKNIKINDAQVEALRSLGVLKFATKVQLSKQLNKNIRRGKQTVDFLKDNHVLVQHILEDTTSKSMIPFYSLSDEAASQLNIEPTFKYNVQQILKQLLLSQFYVRFKEIDSTTKALPFPSPFDGAFSLLNLDFRVGIIRGSTQSIIKHFLYHNEQMRTLLVVESLEEVSELLELSTGFFRVTTDFHLLKSELSNSFHKAQEGVWMQEIIPSFQIKEK